MIIPALAYLLVSWVIPPELILDRSFEGKEIPVILGQPVTVKLKCIPGSGYRWYPVDTGSRSLLEKENSRFEPIPGQEDKVGAPEFHVFRYIAVRPGKVVFWAICARAPGMEIKDRFVVTLDINL